MYSSGKTKFGIAILILVLIALIFGSCGEKSTESTEQPPVIPPASTFLMDFSSFTGASTSASAATTSTFANWGWAGINVLFWNAVITVHAVVPVAAYLESFKHIPVKQENGSWLWTYSVKVGNATYTAKLYASTDAEGVNWSMYLSLAGSFTDFLWYTGENDLVYMEGTWTLYKSPDDPVEYIGIVWHRNLVNSTADIRYMNIEPESDGNGGYITYGTLDNDDFDAFYEIYIIEQDHLIDIGWNLDTRVGRVKDTTYFHNDLWHCWDENLEDIDCDSI